MYRTRTDRIVKPAKLMSMRGVTRGKWGLRNLHILEHTRTIPGVELSLRLLLIQFKEVMTLLSKIIINNNGILRYKNYRVMNQ